MIRAIGGLAAAAAILASCGSTDEAGRVRDTVQAAIAAGAHGNLREACAFATPAGRARFVKAFSHVYDTATGRYGPVYRSCEAVLRQERSADRSELEQIRRGKVSDVRVRGATATALVTDDHGDSGHVTLRKVSGRWLLDDSDALPVGD